MQHQIFGAVERAKQALRAKDVDTALVHLKSADILDQIMGSDHCPIDIVLRF